MNKKSYGAALDDVLTPIGFVQGRMEWSRTVGDIFEQVDLQVSPNLGVTSNLWTKDLATEELLRQAIPWKRPIGIVQAGFRIGRLMGCGDRWWKKDPNGPAELAEAIRLHAPAFFEGRRSLEAQALWFGRLQPRWSPGNTAGRMYLALTLYRMGEFAEARQILVNPPKTAPASGLAEAESVRQWIEAATGGA